MPLKTSVYPCIFYHPPAIPVLKGICGRTEASVKESAERFGYAYGTANWKDLIADPEIQALEKRSQ